MNMNETAYESRAIPACIYNDIIVAEKGSCEGEARRNHRSLYQ